MRYTCPPVYFLANQMTKRTKQDYLQLIKETRKKVSEAKTNHERLIRVQAIVLLQNEMEAKFGI